MINVTAYEAYLGTLDHGPAYTFYKRQLQLLQWQRGQSSDEHWYVRARVCVQALAVVARRGVTPSATPAAMFCGTAPPAVAPRLLKTPNHLSTLPELARTMPDARIVMLHRDPVKVCCDAAWVPADAVRHCVLITLTPCTCALSPLHRRWHLCAA